MNPFPSDGKFLGYDVRGEMERELRKFVIKEFANYEGRLLLKYCLLLLLVRFCSLGRYQFEWPSELKHLPGAIWRMVFLPGDERLRSFIPAYYTLATLLTIFLAWYMDPVQYYTSKIPQFFPTQYIINYIVEIQKLRVMASFAEALAGFLLSAIFFCLSVGLRVLFGLTRDEAESAVARFMGIVLLGFAQMTSFILQQFFAALTLIALFRSIGLSMYLLYLYKST